MERLWHLRRYFNISQIEPYSIDGEENAKAAKHYGRRRKYHERKPNFLELNRRQTHALAALALAHAHARARAAYDYAYNTYTCAHTDTHNMKDIGEGYVHTAGSSLSTLRSAAPLRDRFRITSRRCSSRRLHIKLKHKHTSNKTKMCIIQNTLHPFYVSIITNPHLKGIQGVDTCS